MNNYGPAWLAAVLLIMVTGTGAVVVADEPATQLDATVLWYEEQEAGTDVYPVRMLVTDAYLRIDDGTNGGDFVLLDRRTRTIYSVSHEEQSTMEMTYQSARTELPDNLALTEDVQTDDQAPAIAGKKPRHVRLLANGSSCYEAVIVPGLLKEATAALVQYARTLGARQLNALQEVPADIQTPCYLARYAFAPERHYLLGFPVQEWDGAGYRRALVNYSEANRVAASLFEVPASYQLYRIGG
jgi:hypothetical protein